MKQIIVTLSLIALCTPQITCAMEMDKILDIELKPIYRTNQQLTQTHQSTTNTLSLDELVSTIDAAINDKYPHHFFKFLSTQLTEQDFLNIINIIMEHSATPTHDLFRKLYPKNDHYKNAVLYFFNFACKNKDNVTIDTLETIQDPTLLQPTTELNQLPIHFKKYLMDAAYNNLKDSYAIIHTGHTDTINFFDICIATHQAATSSQDKTLRLWSLLTGKLIHTFPEDNASTIFCIAFNPDGSLLATADRPDGSYHAGPYCASNKVNNIIKIWSTESAQLLHAMQHNTEIRSLCYTHNDLLVLCKHTRSYDSNIEIISANKDNMKKIATTTKNMFFPAAEMVLLMSPGIIYIQHLNLITATENKTLR